MALIELKLNPTRRELRVFGLLLFPAFFAIVGALVWKVGGSPRAAIAVWSAALAVSLIGLASLAFLRAVYVGWMYAVYPIGWTLSHLMFGFAYYILFTPVGFLMRLAGRDALKIKRDKSARTYWVPRQPAENVDQYFRQF